MPDWPLSKNGRAPGTGLFMYLIFVMSYTSFTYYDWNTEIVISTVMVLSFTLPQSVVSKSDHFPQIYLFIYLFREYCRTVLKCQQSGIYIRKFYDTPSQTPMRKKIHTDARIHKTRSTTHTAAKLGKRKIQCSHKPILHKMTMQSCRKIIRN